MILNLQGTIGNHAVQLLLKRRPDRSDVAPAVRSVEKGATGLPSSGAALDGDVQVRYERLFGTSLADVRIHTDARAAASAKTLNAEAYTVGRDIVFDTGRYQPGSAAGQHLLAHELAHVMQEPSSMSAATPLTVSEPGDNAEREADRAAEVLVAGGATRIATGMEPPVIRRQARQPRRADRFLPNERAELRRLGRGELDELIDQIIADGAFHRVRSETIEGVEHTWEVKTEIVELSEREQLEGARFGGAVGPEVTIAEADSKRRHRLTYMLRGGRASTIEAALHELIHLRIMIDRRLPEEKRSTFYSEYAQLAEMTEVLPGTRFGAGGTISQKSSYGALPIVAGTWRQIEMVLKKIEAIRSFLGGQDASAVAAFASDPALTPAALIEFITQEKYVTQTAARAVSGRPPNNETVATRYARSVAARFEGHLSEAALRRINTSQVGTKQRSDLVDELRLAMQRLYDALDQLLLQAREFAKSPSSPPASMPNPRLFESPPLGIGGEPLPLK